MSSISMKQLLEAGVHFGHQTRRWNPKMKPYIFGARNGIYIIDLQKTVQLFKVAYQFISDTVASGHTVLFVGTKKQAADSIADEAERAGQYYVASRWLGGMLTNWQTITQSINKLKNLERMRDDGSINNFPKKEIISMQRLGEKLEKNLGGIKDMERLPGALFVIDPRREKIAVNEANKLGIPVVAVVDTNCDPDNVDFVIPGNDDAIRAIRLLASRMADACLEGQARREEAMSADNEDEAFDQDRVQPYVADAPGEEAPPAEEKEVIVIKKQGAPKPAPAPAEEAAPAPAEEPEA